MADEQHEMLGGDRIVPVEFGWQSLLNRSGADLEAHYSDALAALGTGEDMLGVVFHKARNRIQTPAKLEQLIKEFIDQHEWMSYDADLKGDAYEGLIEKTAQEGARGAGQYFTPRALINAIVDVMQPEPDDRICDPACGTGGFFLGAYRSIVERFPHLEPDQVAHLRSGAFTGWEIADLPARLCAMNMLLHGIESPESDSPIVVDDALRDSPGKPFDMVLTNPPFGRSSSDSYGREDFWATTKNKQLNFVQHVVSLLKIGGDAAVVVPDNVLFEAGAGETIRRRLLHDCEVHTLLRLPTGIFYAQGVKANVLFFRRREGAEDAWTRELWVYDLRTNKHFTLKQSPLTRADLDDFVACYQADARHKHPFPPQPGPPPRPPPRRLRPLLPGRSPPQTCGVRTVQALHLRRTDRPRQGQPRSVLAARREPRRRRPPPTPSHPRRRDHRRPPIRPHRDPSPHRSPLRHLRSRNAVLSPLNGDLGFVSVADRWLELRC